MLQSIVALKAQLKTVTEEKNSCLTTLTETQTTINDQLTQISNALNAA